MFKNKSMAEYEYIEKLGLLIKVKKVEEKKI